MLFYSADVNKIVEILKVIPEQEGNNLIYMLKVM